MTSNHLKFHLFFSFFVGVSNVLFSHREARWVQCKRHHLPIVSASVFIHRLCVARKSLVLQLILCEAEQRKDSGWLVPLSCLAYIPFSWTFCMDVTWDFVLEFLPSCHIIIEISCQDEPGAYRRHEYAIIPTWAQISPIQSISVHFFLWCACKRKIAIIFLQSTNYMDTNMGWEWASAKGKKKTRIIRPAF